MTPVYIEERCSCNAKFKVPARVRHLDAIDLLEDWRANHRHEMPSEPDEPPTVVESGSSHERAVNEYGVSDRAQAGFAREAR